MLKRIIISGLALCGSGLYIKKTFEKFKENERLYKIQTTESSKEFKEMFINLDVEKEDDESLYENKKIINELYNVLSPFFLSEKGSLKYKNTMPEYLGIEQNNYLKVNLSNGKVGYCKVITKVSHNSDSDGGSLVGHKETDVFMRIFLEDWEGYVDIFICELEGRINKETYTHTYKINRRNECLINSPKINEIMSFNVIKKENSNYAVNTENSYELEM